MKKLKKLVVLGLSTILLTFPLQAASVKKNVTYTYNSVYLNGSYRSLTESSVQISGKTYVPLRAFCNALGLSANINGSNINLSSYTSGLSNSAELQAKQHEIDSLKKELAKYKGETATLYTSSSSSKNTSSYNDYKRTDGKAISSSELNYTEKMLNNVYDDYFSDIDFDYDLTLKSSYIKVRISYDTAAENRDFEKLASSKVKNFMEDVCEEIRRRHDGIEIEGDIYYTKGRNTKYTFKYSKSDKFTYDKKYSRDDDKDDNDDRDDIERVLKKISKMDIDGFKNSVYVKDYDLSMSDSREEVIFKLYLDTAADSDIKSAWNEKTGTNHNSALKNDLRDIGKDIEEETDYDIEGILYDSNGHKIADYDYDDNELRTYSID